MLTQRIFSLGGKMGGGDKKYWVSCIVSQESILLFLVHSLIKIVFFLVVSY